MYTRSFTDRIRIQFEILTESLTDFVGQNAIRKPLLLLAGIAVIMTMKNARYSINYIKTSKLSPFSSSRKATSSFFSPTYGGSTSSGIAASSPNFGQPGRVGATSGFGAQPNLQRQTGGMVGGMNGGMNGGLPSSSGFGNQGTAAFTNNMRSNVAPSFPSGGATSNSGFSTSNLVDSYGTSVNVVQGGLFHDFGSSSGFSGQIETVSAPDGFGFVEQILRSPGMGKVLVVDGGGMNGALFDASSVNVAQQNGWKGVIINGYVRNGQTLQSMPFGVKALGTHPQKGMQTMGQRNVPLMFGGVNFTPGAWVYADKDGIVVSQTSLNSGSGGMPSIGSSGMYGGTTLGMGMAQPQMGQQQYPGMASQQFGGVKPPMPQQQFPNNSAGMTGIGTIGAGTTPRGFGTQGGGVRPLSSTATSSQFGGSTSPFGNRGRTSSLRGSMYGGRGRKKPSKKTLLAMLLFICAVVFVLLGD